MNEPIEDTAELSRTAPPQWTRSSIVAMLTDIPDLEEEARQKKCVLQSIGAGTAIGVGLTFLGYGSEQSAPVFQWLGTLLLLAGVCMTFPALIAAWAPKHPKRFTFLLFNIAGMFGLTVTQFAFATVITTMPFHIFLPCLLMIVPIAALLFVVAGIVSLPAGCALDAVVKQRGQVQQLGCGADHEGHDR